MKILKNPWKRMVEVVKCGSLGSTRFSYLRTFSPGVSTSKYSVDPLAFRLSCSTSDGVHGDGHHIKSLVVS